MNQVLLTLGALTLGGSAAVFLLSLTSRSTRGRYGAKWRCWAWLLLCLRLALPFQLMPRWEAKAPFQMDVPPTPVITPGPTVPGQSPTVPPSAGSTQSGPTPPAGPADGSSVTPPDGSAPLPPVEAKSSRSISLAHILLWIWLAGAAAATVWNLRAHFRFLNYLRRWASPVTDAEAVLAFNRLGDQLELDRRPRLLVCQGLKVPMLAGIFRPAILLPQGNISGEELGFSLLHELTHYRRRDIWLKSLSMWVSTLHWFNPFMWYMMRLVERDTELACDEDALRRLSPEDYSPYGQTILAAVARLQNRERIETDE